MMSNYYAQITSPEVPMNPAWMAYFDEKVPTLSGGEGGIEIGGRPQRKSFTEWTGNTPLKLDFGVVIEGFAEADASGRVVTAERSVEIRVSRLRRLASSPGDYVRPPLVNVAGASFPALALDVDWMISSVTYGDAIVSDDGARVRQDATISMIEYVAADIMLQKNPVVTGKPKPNYRMVLVKRGDTLPKMAARLLKSAKRWKEIEKLNANLKLRGPKFPARLIGKKVRVPLR